MMRNIALWMTVCAGVKMYTPRIRSIRAALKEIHEEDSDSQITRFMIDEAIEKGCIRCTMSGRKKMVNVDEILHYFGGMGS